MFFSGGRALRGGKGGVGSAVAAGDEKGHEAGRSGWGIRLLVWHGTCILYGQGCRVMVAGSLLAGAGISLPQRFAAGQSLRLVEGGTAYFAAFVPAQVVPSD